MKVLGVVNDVIDSAWKSKDGVDHPQVTVLFTEIGRDCFRGMLAVQLAPDHAKGLNPGDRVEATLTEHGGEWGGYRRFRGSIAKVK